MRRVRRSKKLQEAELDITAFMNLMIVLVPVLLLGMVFSQITVLDLKLPDISVDTTDNKENKLIELIIREEAMYVNYPQGVLLKRIPKVAVSDGNIDEDTQMAEKHDFKFLSLVLQELKRQLGEKNVKKRSISILSDADTHYQTIVSAMDTVRSYKAVIATSVVDAELFPEVSLGDSPETSPASDGSDS